MSKIALDPALESSIIRTLERNGEVVFVAYSMLENFEDGLKFILGRALHGGTEDDLFSPVFTCIKELTTNAIKANIKQVLIDEGTIRDPSDPVETVTRIKSVLNERGMLEYALKCRERRLSVRVYVRTDNDRLSVRVINPVPLNEKQYSRIQDKITTARRYESLAEFYLDNPDPMAEGMGLGLSLVIVILKGAQIEDAVFDVTSDWQSKTSAILSIPLSQGAR